MPSNKLKKVLERISPAMRSLATGHSPIFLVKNGRHFLSCIRKLCKNLKSSFAEPCKSNTCGSATALPPVFPRIKARENQHNVYR